MPANKSADPINAMLGPYLYLLHTESQVVRSPKYANYLLICSFTVGYFLIPLYSKITNDYSFNFLSPKERLGHWHTPAPHLSHMCGISMKIKAFPSHFHRHSLANTWPGGCIHTWLLRSLFTLNLHMCCHG